MRKVKEGDVVLDTLQATMAIRAFSKTENQWAGKCCATGSKFQREQEWDGCQDYLVMSLRKEMNSARGKGRLMFRAFLERKQILILII